VSAEPAEVIGLTQSIAYAQHLAGEAGQHGPDGNEGYLARLAAARVTGTGLATGSDMQQAFAHAAAAAAAHAAELTKQLSVQEAYDANPDAGDKDFQLDAGGAGSTLDQGPAKEEAVNEEDDPDAAFRDYYRNATYPFLNRHTEQHRIEAEHDARPELIDEGRRTPQWYRSAAAQLRARAEEIDRMVAGLRPGDRVRQVDDPDGVVWTVREKRDGNDGRVWLGLLRTREDGTEVGTGCPARAIDLVAAATDDEHAAMVKAELLSDLRHKWITPEQYDAAIAQLAASHTGGRR
jgi:hypothetical protein